MGQKQGKVDVGEGQISKMEAAQKAQAEQDRQGGKSSSSNTSSSSGQGLPSAGSQKQMRPTDSFRRYQVAKDEDDDDGDRVVYGDPQSGGGGGVDGSTAGYANIGDFKQDYSGMGGRRRQKQPETHSMDPELAGLRDTLKKKSSSGAMKSL